MHETVLAPAMLHVHRAGWLGHDIARTIMHAAIWRVMWRLPLPLAICLGIGCALVLLVVVGGSRRGNVP